jgi:hypothetical protein
VPFSTGWREIDPGHRANCRDYSRSITYANFHFAHTRASARTATICVYLYDDINGNAMAEDAEVTNTGLAGGQVSITHAQGAYSNVGTTLGNGEPVCFSDIPEGTYSISIAIPDGYNPTSNQNVTVQLKAGDVSHINFSAQVSGHTQAQQEQDATSGSILIAVIGGIIVLAGVGIGIYARYILKH